MYSTRVPGSPSQFAFHVASMARASFSYRPSADEGADDLLAEVARARHPARGSVISCRPATFSNRAKRVGHAGPAVDRG